MKVVIDIEANGLESPTEIWIIVCKDLDSDKYHIFRNPTKNTFEKERFLEFSKQVTLWSGHHILGYDLPVIDHLVGTNLCSLVPNSTVDTLIVSKLIDYSRPGGHSVEQYGEELGLEKGTFFKWTDPELHNVNSLIYKEMEKYCVRDVDIAESIYRKYAGIIHDSAWRPALDLEQGFQLIVNNLHYSGFSFNKQRAQTLHEKVDLELKELDVQILEAFPPKEVLVREFMPKATKFGTISKTSVPRSLHVNMAEYEVGKTYRHTKLVEFNPSSHKQIVEVLSQAKWRPVDKTKTHIDAEREKDYSKLEKLAKTGWKVNENNLATLPEDAPKPARLLAKRILLESRRRTLVEWLSLIREDGRIHGRFYGIGAWTHRMAHQEPNTANIPSAYKMDGTPKLLGKEMRSLWRAPKKRLLVGVDAEGIQLRIFAHYIDDAEFIDALVRGKKDDKTDPHSLNQRVLGSVCRSREAAKRFIYALLLGAGVGKLSEILECTRPECEEALDRLLQRYTGFAKLKKSVIPKDAKKGYFIGLDGRNVPIPGGTESERRHLCMSGYLQNGEAIIIKRTACGIAPLLKPDVFFTNIVHDEFVIEAPNDVRCCEEIKEIICNQIEQVGKDLKLKCPLKGDGHIGLNWLEIH